MNFKAMKNQMRANINNMVNKAVKGQDSLFVTAVDKDEMYELYLSSFPKGTNNLFRERTEHDCSACKRFIRNFGNVVTVENGVVRTIWDFKNDEYQPVLDAMNKFVKSRHIMDVFVTKQAKIGTECNHEEINGRVVKWEHFFVELPRIVVDRSGSSIGEIQGNARSTKDVFKRALREITEDSILTVLELIGQNSLYKGIEWKDKLEKFLALKRQFVKIEEENQDLFAWIKSVKVHPSITKIRSSVVGTLLVDISEDVDLNVAVAKYDDKVAPENFKRTKSIYTKRQLENAQKKVVELGLENSLGRRHASIDDITANNILFVNKDVAKVMELDVFGELEKDLPVNARKFTKTEEITMEKFVNDVLPTARKIEVLFENKHQNNLVSLIAPQDSYATTLFKWDNSFGWAYNGNMADSSMKENVKSHGGKVDGILRFSIQWNDLDTHNDDDLDAHCVQPNGDKISFMNRYGYTGGELDVDIQYPSKGKEAVENITWANTRRMEEGTYKFLVNNYSRRGGRDGFCAEIEFDGNVHTFEYRKDIRSGENVYVAEVEYSKATGFKIKELLPSATSSRNIWGLSTNQFHEVSTVMYSPNYWNEQTGIGNRHYFFMLKGCVNEQSPNGFFNEYLKAELHEDRKVFEALGSKMRVAHTDNQLSGVGFSSTKNAEIVVRVEGMTKRVLKIKL